MIVKSFRIQSFSRICRFLARGHANPCPRKPRRPQPYFMRDETFSRWCQLLRFPCSPSRLSQSSFGNYRPHGKNESKNESSANCTRVLGFPLARLIGLLSIHILGIAYMRTHASLPWKFLDLRDRMPLATLRWRGERLARETPYSGLLTAGPPGLRE